LTLGKTKASGPAYLSFEKDQKGWCNGEGGDQAVQRPFEPLKTRKPGHRPPG
jgi:hypothetical protein